MVTVRKFSWTFRFCGNN